MVPTTNTTNETKRAAWLMPCSCVLRQVTVASAPLVASVVIAISANIVFSFVSVCQLHRVFSKHRANF